MKKIPIILCILLAVSMPAFADHPTDQMGLGLVGGGGVAGNGDLGLSLKLPGLPVFWGIHVNLNSSVISLGATGDFYIYDQNLVTQEGFNLDWFLGLGAYASLSLGSGMHVGVGARVPVGLSFHFMEQFEFWIDAAPSLGIGINPLQFPEWNVAGEAGIRIWL